VVTVLASTTNESVVSQGDQEATPKNMTQSLQKNKKSVAYSSKDVLSSAANARFGQNRLTLDEDEAVVEGPEPIAANELLNALCLTSTSTVTIKPCFSLATLTVSDSKSALLSGVGLGNSNEALQIKLATSGSLDDTIRYGESVAFYSPQKKTFLGIQKISTDEMNGVTWEIVCASPVIGQAERWSILHPNRRLWIGPAALQHMKSKKRQLGLTQMVRSGEAVVLRNHLNGGLLSVNSADATIGLTVLTDSYEESHKGESAADRIEHHSQIVPSDRQSFRLFLSNVPPCPHWIIEKSVSFRLTGTLVTGGNIGARNAQKLCPLEQERMLVDEVIASMMGLEGELIKIIHDPKTIFALDEETSVTPSLRNLVDFILPLSTSYISIRRFLADHVPGYEFGRIVQALCQAVDDLLQEYDRDMVSISLEFRNSQIVGETPLTLNNLFVRVQGHRHTLSILDRVVLEAKVKKGGCLLNAIRDLKLRMFVGDSQAQAILHLLLDRSSVPYMAILQSWLETGILDDPFNEFMIERSHESTIDSLCDGDSWNRLFMIVTENVIDGALSPNLLREKVLATGKYLNAIHFCETGEFVSHSSAAVEQKATEPLVYNMDQPSLASTVDRLYQSVSTRLLRLILCDYDLPRSLRTMKRYFLLDQGDFLLNFLGDAESELSRDVSSVSLGRTQHWLSTALQVTETTLDDSMSVSTLSVPLRTLQPLSACFIRCKFAADSLIAELDSRHSSSGGIQKIELRTPSKFPYGTVKGLTGMMAFTLDFPVVEFPTSLFISEQNLSKYKLLFRQLFFAKNIERRLVAIWSSHQTMKLLQDLHGDLRQTFCLRQRMLHLMQNLIYYMMLEVIEPNWRELTKTIGEQYQLMTDLSHRPGTETVDSLMKAHNLFLDQSLEQCLLTNQTIVQSLTKLMTTCLLFSEQMDRFMLATKINEENEIAANKKRSLIQRNLNSLGKPSMNGAQLRRIVAQDQEERRHRIEKQTTRVERELHNESYKRMIKRYCEVFDANLSEFMQTLQSESKGQFQSHIANLCIRLDFNGFFTQQIDCN